MIKDSVSHGARKNKHVADNLCRALDKNPNALKGLKIPANDVVRNDIYNFRNISIAGLLLTFFVRVFH